MIKLRYTCSFNHLQAFEVRAKKKTTTKTPGNNVFFFLHSAESNMVTETQNT